MLVEVSNGELVDKLTILEIKLAKFHSIKETAKDRKAFIKHEHDLLKPIVELLNIDEKIINELREINSMIWDVEDQLRKKEKAKEFDDEFIILARTVYVSNDTRFQIKDDINKKTSSEVQEQKLYGYT